MVEKEAFLLMAVLFITVIVIVELSNVENNGSPTIIGRAVTLCSKGNECDGKNPGEGFTCDGDMIEDYDGAFNCVCNENCIVEASLICSIGNACDGRTPGSVYKCDSEMEYDEEGEGYCLCNSRCEVEEDS